MTPPDQPVAMDKVKVAVRVRPFNRREKALNTCCIVEMDGNQTILHHPEERQKTPKSFTFDHCFNSLSPDDPQFASQEDVFDQLGKDILANAFNGYNACIFAYGQTGSGKSYSMMGGQEEPGIIPRLCVNLFEKIGSVSNSSNQAKVEVSYMEIYNEKVYDLLGCTSEHKTGLKVREHKLLGPYVDGLSQLAVVSFQEIENLMIEGNKSRTVAATNMNCESSRSHAVFTIILTFTLTDLRTGVSGEKVSRVSLVDLAGSERAVKTGATGDRLKEGSNINKSLTTLGLVISKLAEQGGKGKDKFVPYRDSVLTWLLKDNLGGNSRTVMVATVSPAADNFEETLSTLRYAYRAKMIVNHAVVNEDPNARIIRELRAEVEALKDMLLHAAQPEILKEKLSENEKLMKEMSLTWEEKLEKTEQKQEDRRHALEKMGISVQSSGIKVEKNKYFLVNLNSDPSLNELLVYYLKDRNLVGRADAPNPQDIQLSGLGIQSEHCVIEVINKELYITPVLGARTCINGREIVEQTQVQSGDRLLWGSNHFFRVNCPKVTPEVAVTPKPFDWRMAQEEVMMADSDSSSMKEAIARLERRHEEEKQIALESQRKEYERQFQHFQRHLMSPSANMEHIGLNDSFHQKRSPKFCRLLSTEESFRQGLVRLREDIIQANGMVREANLLAEEVGNMTRYSVTLQIAAQNLAPGRQRGGSLCEAAILVKSQGQGSQVWTMGRLENRLVSMRELYEDKLTGNIVAERDPFFQASENQTFIGVANIFLDVLFQEVTLCYQAPIVSPQGEVVGRLVLEIERVGGGMLSQDRLGVCESNSEDSRTSSQGDEEAPAITIRLAIREATGISPCFNQFVCCEYNLWGDPEVTRVPPVLDPQFKPDNRRIKFDHQREVTLPITEELLEHISDGALSIEVYGQEVSKEDSPDEATARSLAERWRELTKRLQLQVEVQELNDAGEYVPVEVVTREEAGTGGVLQLRQGQQRRLGVAVTSVPDSGLLPLVCDAVVSVSVGGLCVRSKMQKPLDSYQEQDLCKLRERWGEALAKRKEYLDSQIQALMTRPNKNRTEEEREQCLVEQWVRLTEERNAVLAPCENSGVPGAPTNLDYIPSPGLELHTPVIFLNLDAMDLTEDSPEYDEDLPFVGADLILPKEHGARFVPLPILRDLVPGKVGALCSWDSSVHDSTCLNRITEPTERAYMIVKVVVRLSHPTPINLVLRKRVSFNIFKRQSLSERIRKKMGHSSGVECVGVVYEVVSSVPKASEELEERGSLAMMAGSGQEVLTGDGESFIEQYTRGAAAVQDLLQLDRVRQSVAVKEALAAGVRQNDPIQSLRKTLSVPNIRQVMKGSFSLDSLVGHQLSESFSELSWEGPGGRQEEGAKTVTRRLPLSLTMSTLHEERGSRQVETIPELASISEQDSAPPPSLPKSTTSDSLAEPTAKDNSPSMMSSGYQSQAVSSSTLSSEDSLSLQEETDGVVRRVQKPRKSQEKRLSCPPQP